MDDAFGNELFVGDYVLYADTGDGSSLFIGQIEKINPKTVRVRITEGGWRLGNTSTVGPNRVSLARSIQSPEEIQRQRENVIRDTLNDQLSDDICNCEDFKLKVVVRIIKILKAKGLDNRFIQYWFETTNDGLDNQSPVATIMEPARHRALFGTRLLKAAEAVVV